MYTPEEPEEKAMMKRYEEFSLVDVKQFVPTIVLDIRYATTNNFIQEAIYEEAKCYLHKEAAIRLQRVQKEAENIGLSLKIFDGYRPLSVQQQMWDCVLDERYVSNPAVNKGRHTRGTAVDLTLIDEKGHELLMPSPFDDFTEMAHSDSFLSIPLEAVKNRALLKQLMERHGFQQLPTEWWHFDLEGWNNDQLFPPHSETFAELEKP